MAAAQQQKQQQQHQRQQQTGKARKQPQHRRTCAVHSPTAVRAYVISCSCAHGHIPWWRRRWLLLHPRAPRQRHTGLRLVPAWRKEANTLVKTWWLGLASLDT